MKIAYWDIETTDLNPAVGRIIACSVLDANSDKIVSFRNDKLVKSGKATDMSDDHAICVLLRDLLEEYHITVGWYSKGFDISFLNSRLITHGEKPLRSALHLDGIWYAKGWRGMKATSASLAAVARFLGLEESKMQVGEDIWASARGGNKEAIDTIVERCESDVRLTRSVTERLLTAGLVKNIQHYP